MADSEKIQKIRECPILAPPELEVVLRKLPPSERSRQPLNRNLPTLYPRPYSLTTANSEKLVAQVRATSL